MFHIALTHPLLRQRYLFRHKVVQALRQNGLCIHVQDRGKPWRAQSLIPSVMMRPPNGQWSPESRSM